MRHLRPSITGMAHTHTQHSNLLYNVRFHPHSQCVWMNSETQPNRITTRQSLNINCCIFLFSMLPAPRPPHFLYTCVGKMDGMWTYSASSTNPFLSECLQRDECQKSPMKICLVVSPPSNKLLQVRQKFLFSSHKHKHTPYTWHTNAQCRTQAQAHTLSRVRLSHNECEHAE